MEQKEYEADIESVAKRYGTDSAYGLDESRIESRQERYGKNKLKDAPKTPIWKRLIKQLADPMIIMLLVAAIISAIIARLQGSDDLADVIIIMVVVIINSVLGVVQEMKSDDALEALKQMNTTMSKVIRNGHQLSIPAEDLVPGDVIILEAGDTVPADARVIESASMKIEEAALTGESVPVEKQIDPIAPHDDTQDIPLGDRKNMCYLGSTVVYGRGRAIVTGTGMDTEMGKIADVLTEAKDELTPLQVKLAELSRILTALVIAICVAVFAANLIEHGSRISDTSFLIDTFMVAVSLAVAAIPEGLVAVVTIVLSLGVTKMARRKAIIRKLSAVETLGCTQIICSDKTGTLTQNKMTVVQHMSESDERELIKGMVLCSDAKWDEEARKSIGEPTEAALLDDAERNGITDDLSNYERVAEIPFDSSRKMMTVIVKDRDGKLTQYTKGAPDVILSRCAHTYDDEGNIVPLDAGIREMIAAENKSLADQALRILALAGIERNTVPDDISTDTLENNLVFYGLVGMIDPIRPEVKDAIDEATNAGIDTIMITGDHIDTAVAIANQLGIITDRNQATTGSELDKISDEELKEKVADYRVYARVQPEHKTRIVEAWKARGKVVAMTGDGVNDAPSIKRADIGIGMGITGTDVTKNVADMILADDNFATIVSACKEGRRIYDNIRKAIQFLISANLAEVLAVFISSIIGFTIFQPIQLLWINLATDCLPALALGMEDEENDIMDRAPRDSKDGIFAGHMGTDCVIQGILITVLVMASFFAGVYLDMGYIDIAQMNAGDADLEGVMMAFITLTAVEIFHSINMRSRRESIFKMKTHNKWLIFSSIAAIALTVLVVAQPALSSIFFGNVTLPVEGYIISIVIAALIIPTVEIQKAIMRKIEK